LARELCGGKTQKKIKKMHKGKLKTNTTTTTNLPWNDIFENSVKGQSSKLEFLFSLKRGKRDV